MINDPVKYFTHSLLLDQEIEALIELTKGLKRKDIKKIHKRLMVPESVCDDKCKVIDFLEAMKKWEYFRSYVFYRALETIRPDLVPTAVYIPWLCSTVKPTRRTESPLSVITLIEMLRSEIPIGQIQRIYKSYKKSPGESDEEIGFENTMKLLFENNLIQKDLTSLCQLMNNIKLYEVAQSLEAYKREFKDVPDRVFRSNFREAYLGKQIVQ